ncbi:MAG: amidohydrolase family protein [Eubacteriales bacterium]|nr:amidohydrolase family protein [Eubacteriales bacterium]
MIVKGGKTITPYGFFKNQDIKVESQKITELGNLDNAGDQTQEIFDVSGLYVSPGFIDIHSHGGIGYNLMCDNEQDILNAVRECGKFGVTSVMPTIDGNENLTEEVIRQYQAYNDAMKHNETGTQILGVHVEGPYFPASQNPRRIDIIPDLENVAKLIELAPCIKRVTTAPEVEHGLELIDLLVKNGIAVSVGHCEASFDKVAEAYSRGARQVTHFFTGMKGVYREETGDRKPGLIETAQILDFVIEVIANGRHVSPELLNMVYRVKGADKVCIVTDSHYLPEEESPGDNAHWSKYVCKADFGDGKLHLNSFMPMPIMVKVMVKEAGVSLIDAVRMATLTPAETMKVDDVKGKLLPGYDADIVAFDDDFNIKLVIARGTVVKNAL